MAKWQVRYILPEHIGKYFYGEVEADTAVDAKILFEKVVPRCKVVGNPRQI